MDSQKRLQQILFKRIKHLEISIGEPGNIKNTYIKNPTWEQVEKAISLLNGIDRRSMQLSGIFKVYKVIQVVGGIISTESGHLEQRVNIYYQDSRDKNYTIIELLAPNSTNTEIVSVHQYIYRDRLRPYNQTVPIALAIQVAKDIWDGKDVLTLYKWTDKRDYGG